MRILAVVLLVTVIAACGGETPDVVIGQVVAVEGDLEQTTGFSLRADGRQYDFTPADGLTFHGGPLSHLSDHVRSGVPVEVQFKDRDGLLVAVSVGDAP